MATAATAVSASPAAPPQPGAGHHTAHSLVDLLLLRDQVIASVRGERRLWIHVLFRAIQDGFPQLRLVRPRAHKQARCWILSQSAAPGTYRWAIAALLPNIPEAQMMRAIESIWAGTPDAFMRRIHPEWVSGRKGYWTDQDGQEQEQDDDGDADADA